MEKNVFITSAPVPPARWRQAFPKAEIASTLPTSVPAGSIVWLHNMTSTQVLGGKSLPGVFFVVLHDEPSDEAGLTALGQGASGYCNAHATPELLMSVASVVRGGGLWVGESLLNRLIGNISARATTAGQVNQHHSLLKPLSERERQVALCVASGQSNKEIARQLDVSERTIKAHLSSVFEKLNIRDRLRLAILLSTPE
jgi:DNA-binding NarL/FixJ family response regulator